MTSSPFRLLDTIALLDGVPAHGLVRGQVGTLVEPLADGVWLVEFADDKGRTTAMPDLREDQMLLLHFAPADAA
ncbi:DUF4926 domain-containing protein [Rubrivirga sp.]|uniref:DUF4926 domain-containing protein n=1 Tax=Rubrivirga sp. TaxID=1885344 RepID=UPI003B522070